MSQQLLITITTKDGASQTFRTIGTSATSMGNAIKSAATGAGGSVTKLGSESNKAASGMDKLGQSAGKSADQLKQIEDRATKIGAALGTAVAALSKFGAQAETQRRQVDGIQRAYGDAADEILKFTETIQDSTAFSNEDAREAAQIAATLAQNYGFTTQEVEKLIKVSADLAAVKGIDLADAVQRTSSAMRGEAESAEFLGLTLNQQAIDREGVTLSMSNEEAAHFRLNALLEQAAYAEGTAGEAAQTAAGQAAQLANNMQDLTTGIGAALGPIAGSAAGLADMALILPVVGAGVGKMAAKFGEWQIKAKSASAASNVLAAAMTPIGASLGAATLVVGAAVLAWADLQAQNEMLAASFDRLDESVKQLDTASARENVRGLVDEVARLESVPLSSDNGPIQNIIDGLTESAAELKSEFIDTTSAFIDTSEVIGNTTGEVEHAIENMVGAIESQSIRVEDASAAWRDYNDIMTASGPNIDLVQNKAQGLFDKFASGAISAEQFAAELEKITSIGIGDWADNAAQMLQRQFDAMNAQTLAFKAMTAAEKAFLDGEANRVRIGQEGIAQMQREKAEREGLEQGIYGQWRAMNVQADAYTTQIDKSQEYQEQLAAEAEAQRQTAAALRDQLVPGLAGASSGFAGMVQPGEDVLDTLARIAPNVDNVGGSFLQFVDNLNDAQQALSGVLGMFSAIDALGGGAGQAESIATDLIGAPGEWATIDDLVSNAAISQGTYNRAVESGLSIQSNNLAIQEDLNAIRAQQLPLLDSQVTKVAAYVDGLAEASAAEQQQALYLMDSANQAKVAASYSTAYAASLGEIPADVATQIIADGAQADPVLGDILEKFGLIEVGADGTVSVNFPDAATLDDVTTSIDRLNNTVVEVGVAMTGDTDLRANLVEANSELDALDGRVATAEVAVKVTGLDAAMASGAGFGATMEQEAVTVPVKADTASFNQSLDNLTTNKTVEVKVTADTSAFDAALGGVSTGGKSAKITIDAEDNASSVIARAMQAGDAFDGQTFTSTLDASDESGGTVAQAMQAANAYATGEYNASLIATDSASSVIAIPQGNATAFAVGEYNASLIATDSASSIIGTAQSAATAFATTYAATLQAVDNASGTIDAVAAKLAALDGTTATTYITTQEISSLPAKMLGGAIVPHAATGRVVQVGEAGPEAVVLPFGSMVQPSPASPARTAQEDKPNRRKFDLPDVDLKEAYRKGGDSATAFYDGLLDKAKSRISEIKSELGSTIYGSRAEAENALRDYQGFLNQREKLKKLKDRAQGFDREQMQAARQAERAANDVTHTMDAAGEEIAASGAEAGTAFSEELAAGIDVSSALEQVRVLKDEFVTAMMASAGAASDTQTAVHSFEKEIRDAIGSLRYSSKVSDAVSESVVEDFGAMEDAAINTGEAAGDELASGLESGAADATESLIGVSEQMNAIGEATIQPQIGADSKQATEALGQTSKELGVLDGDSAMVAIHVDDSEWQSFKDDVENSTLEATVETKTKDKSKDEEAKKLGGVILADEVPHAALGRVVTVGESGPESVVLPFGAMVTPHPASAARLASEPRPAMNFYAPVHVHAATPDIYAAIAAQLTGDGRQ